MGDREEEKVPSPAALEARSLPLSGEHPLLVLLPPLSPPSESTLQKAAFEAP